MRKAVVGPVVIDGVQIENIDFSDAYEKSIEDRMKAEVAIATRKQNLETEKIQAQIAVTQARLKQTVNWRQPKQKLRLFA